MGEKGSIGEAVRIPLGGGFYTMKRQKRAKLGKNLYIMGFLLREAAVLNIIFGNDLRLLFFFSLLRQALLFRA